MIKFANQTLSNTLDAGDHRLAPPLGVSPALGCWDMGALSTLRTWTIHSFAGPSLFVTGQT